MMRNIIMQLTADKIYINHDNMAFKQTQFHKNVNFAPNNTQ